MSADPEVQAMADAYRIISARPEVEQERIMAWLAARLAHDKEKRHANGGPSIGRESNADAAYAVLTAAGRPMTVAELVEATEKRMGMKLGGTKPLYNFSSTLSRDKRMKSVHWKHSRRWWLTAVALPPETQPTN